QPSEEEELEAESVRGPAVLEAVVVRIPELELDRRRRREEPGRGIDDEVRPDRPGEQRPGKGQARGVPQTVLEPPGPDVREEEPPDVDELQDREPQLVREREAELEVAPRDTRPEEVPETEASQLVDASEAVVRLPLTGVVDRGQTHRQEGAPRDLLV